MMTMYIWHAQTMMIAAGSDADADMRNLSS